LSSALLYQGKSHEITRKTTKHLFLVTRDPSNKTWNPSSNFAKIIIKKLQTGNFPPEDNEIPKN
jgi:hypothetical protein